MSTTATTPTTPSGSGSCCPAVYRTADTDRVDATGPLRELLNRIGAQVAVVRRSIDRLWADQSIETCDDWVIPYIGDLLGTNLVTNLDPRGQRLDVAKTIHYRRRKGTLQVLEELALDVTGWTAHGVEAFRRLARTRHGLDPVLGPGASPDVSAGDVAPLLQAEGLTGRLTGTPAGGFADLRSSAWRRARRTAPSTRASTLPTFAGDRAPSGISGSRSCSCSCGGCGASRSSAGRRSPWPDDSGQYVFDPTGREIPLFLPPPAAVDDFSGDWTPAREWQVPGPLTGSLDTAIGDTGGSAPRVPYPDNDVPPRYALGGGTGGSRRSGPSGAASRRHPRDRPAAHGQLPVRVLLDDRRRPVRPQPARGPSGHHRQGDATSRAGAAWTPRSRAPAAIGTVTIADSLTYRRGSAPPQVRSTRCSSARAPPSARCCARRPERRPGSSPARGEAQLVLDGLTVSGCDIVLRGSFDTVRITACTIDPGTAGRRLAAARDGGRRRPSRAVPDLRRGRPRRRRGAIGAIRQLLVDHCILGPIRTRFGGSVETLTITDSIVQGLPATAGTAIFDPLPSPTDSSPALLVGSRVPANPLSAALLAAMPGCRAALRAYVSEPPGERPGGLPLTVLDALNTLSWDRRSTTRRCSAGSR